METFGMIFNLLGSLGVFLYGMKVMSDGINRVAGSKMKNFLNYMTKNRIFAVITGILITALIQSSSATTVMVVSFVNAGLLSLVQSIGVIMGANVGTTVTTWLVSFLGFGKFSISTIALPMIGVGLFFFFSKSKKKRDWADVLIGFGLLFLGLDFLKNSVPNINEHQEVLEFVRGYTGRGFLSYLIFVSIGAILTVVIQSSSAAMAITVTMAFKGWIDFPTAAMIVLGENIGTTITVYLASIGTVVNARRAARAHLLFNLFGVFWMTFVFSYFVKFIQHIAPWEHSLQNLPLTLSLFHTVFNLMNTFICIWFISYFAKIVEYFVKPSKIDQRNDYQLVYLESGRMNSIALNLEQASLEVRKLAKICDVMFEQTLDLYFLRGKKVDDILEDVKAKEVLTDQMQKKITEFLTICAGKARSQEYMKQINAMIRISHELEGAADSITHLCKMAQRKKDQNITMHKTAELEIEEMSRTVREFMELYDDNMMEHIHGKDMKLAFDIENRINKFRKNYKSRALDRISSNEADVSSEMLYIDMLRHFEHIGDYSLNIVQCLRSLD